MANKKEQIGRNCPFCGAMVSYDEYFCRACHKRFTDLNDLDAPSKHRPDTFVVSLPNIYVSVILSAAGVGLGQFYNGDTLKGIVFFLGFLLVSFGYLVTPFYNQLFFGIWLVAIADATWSSWNLSRCRRSYAGISYAFYVLIALYLLILGLHFSTGLPDTSYLERIFPAAYVYFG
jgi:TM2 domain-containing membrane protein YozV